MDIDKQFKLCWHEDANRDSSKWKMQGDGFE